jgi:hypothetical protein
MNSSYKILAALGLLAINLAILFAGFLSLWEQNDEPSVYAQPSSSGQSRAQNGRNSE